MRTYLRWSFYFAAFVIVGYLLHPQPHSPGINLKGLVSRDARLTLDGVPLPVPTPFKEVASYNPLSSQRQRTTTATPEPTPQPEPAAQLKRGEPVSIPELVSLAKPALVIIETYDARHKPVGLGTGFFFSANGLIATNFHVIENVPFLKITDLNGVHLWFERVVVSSQRKDLAILKVTATGHAHLDLGSTQETLEGQHVLVIGNPQGSQGTVSDGLVAALRRDLGLVQITAPISPGSSGSPVLDAQSGRVLGVATLIFDDGQNLNFAIPAEQISDLLASAQPAAAPPTVRRAELVRLPGNRHE
jgi:S1-C subfamily serine protease